MVILQIRTTSNQTPHCMTNLETELSPKLEQVLSDFLDSHPQQSFLFRTLDANKHTLPVQTGDSVEHKPANPSRMISGSSIIRTPEGRQLNLIYWVRQETQNNGGVTSIMPVPEPITFEAGELCQVTVLRGNRELLIRLLFSNQCRNGINPAKETPNGGLVYELVEPAKTAEKQVADEDKVLDAKILIRTASATERQLAVQRLSLPVSEDENTNRKTLSDHASVDPAGVVAVLGEEWTQTTGFVRDLTTAGIIAFDSPERAYRTVGDQKIILSVQTGDFENALIKHLSDSQGQTLKRQLVRLQTEANSKKGGRK